MRCNALQCAAMRCNALQCAAMRCNALQCAAIRCNALQCALRCSLQQCFLRCTAQQRVLSAAECYIVQQRASVCCSVLQRAAVCCSVLQETLGFWKKGTGGRKGADLGNAGMAKAGTGGFETTASCALLSSAVSHMSQSCYMSYSVV